MADFTYARRSAVLALAVAGFGALSVAPASGSLVADHSFTGTEANAWGFDSVVDPGAQLSGTDELVYTYLDSGNQNSYVAHSITDAASYFPDGQGTVVMTFTVDLSNYPTGTQDFQGSKFIEIGSPGNKSSFTNNDDGAIAGMYVIGWNNPGAYRLSTNTAYRYANGTSANTGAFGIGVSPAFDLIYDVTWTVEITGPGAGNAGVWQTVSSFEAVGPVNGDGEIGTLTASTTSTYNSPASGGTSFNGWLDATEYRLGVAGAGNAVGAGDSITLDSFTATPVPIPEPTSLGLLAGGAGLLLCRRRA